MSRLPTGHRGVVFAGVLVTVLVLALSGGVAATDAVAESASEPESTVDPDLEDVDGEVRVVVEFSDLESVPDGEDAVATRQAHANETQEPLEEYVAETDGIDLEESFWITNVAVATVDTDRIALEEIARLEGVMAVRPETAVVAASGENATPVGNDEYTYGLERLGVPTAWEEFDTRGEGATVVVLDSGVDADHPDIDLDGWKDFSSNPSDDPVDYDGHGTHVTGIVAGGDASGTQIGVAPEVELIHGAVITECNGQCHGSESTVLEGLEWAVEQDADAVSMSFGWHEYVPSLVEAVENANDAGTVVVAGIGNDGEGTSIAPGNVYDAVGVGASTRTDSVVGFSAGEEIDTGDAWGHHAPAEWPDSYVTPDVVAPGAGVKGPTMGGGYATRSGTSKATPHVAGTVALMQSATDDELGPDEIERALRETAWKPDGEPDEPDTRYGHGIVDTRAAIDAVGAHASVTGTVTDAVTDESLEDATVEIVAEDGTTVETETDEDGEFVRYGLEGDGEYTIVVEKDGYETSEETAFIAVDERVTIDVSVAGDGVIEATLTDAQFDAGIEDGTVSANGSRGTYPGTHVADGTYRVPDVPTGERYTLETSADGYVDETRRLSVENETTRSIAMDGDARLEATVENEDEGEPIENASIALERPDGESYAPANLTDENGTLSVTVAGTGEPYTVEASADGFATDDVETEPIESEATESVTVVLAEPLLPTPGFGGVTAMVAMVAVLIALAARGTGRR